MRTRLDAPVRYFCQVYPSLRGARGRIPLLSHLTEPGRNDRLEWVLAEMEAVERASVLDAGCGVGSYAIAMARLGHDVTALDVSETMLDTTRRAAQAAGVAERIELVHDDLRTWSPHRTFTTVLSLGVAEYYADAARILERQYRWAEKSLLVTWSAAGVGPRSVVRHAWLAVNGLSVPLLEAAQLQAILSALPDAEVRMHRTRWTHCAAVRRASGR